MIISKSTPSFTSKFNEIYGHGSILRKYMNVLDEDLTICGQVQHGWAYGAKSIDPSPLPLYVWNERALAGVRARGQDAHLIGAPFIYANFNTEPEMSACSLLAFPDHSTVGCRYEDRYAAALEYAKYLDGLRKTEGFVQITVALHYNDYFDYTTSSVFNRYGIAPVTCGDPMGSKDFLVRTVDLIRKHSIVTSNVASTAIFYACLLNKQAFIGGPVAKRYSLNGSTEAISGEVYDHAWLKKEFPELCCGPQEATPNFDIGARELGLVHKKKPYELWDIMQMCYMRPA